MEVKTKRLFIVDDDPDDRDFMSSALENFGFAGEITGFSNGLRLLTHLSENGGELPDMIALDLNMPVKNGFETLRDLKSDPHYKQIPVIILTSSSREADRITCKDLGCDLFYSKPITAIGYRDLCELMLTKL